MDKYKKKKFRIIAFAFIGIAIIIAFLLVNPIRSLIAINTMEPLASQEVIPGIYAVNNDYVNLYLYKSEDQYIAFDAGVDNKVTESALASFGNFSYTYRL